MVEGISSAFDLTGSYYSRSRRHTMKRIKMQTNFQQHKYPIKEAIRLIGLSYNKKKEMYAKK